MNRKLNVCHISTFPPTQCGMAEYAQDLVRSLGDVISTRIRLCYDGAILSTYEKTIAIHRESSYDEAVAYVNGSVGIDLVSIQHEFGLYGGRAGAFVLKLAKGIRKPIVTTLHTVRRMGRRERRVIEELASRSSRVVVLTKGSAATLLHHVAVPASKVEVIRHGVPEVDFRRPESCDSRKTLEASVVFVSAGHLKPSKGYHIALEALARYKEIDAHFKYVILGTHQPQFPWDAPYRIELERTIARLGLEANVVRVDSYLSRNEMLERILGADIALVTYTHEEQNASGVLPLFLGCGRVVIATAFECARSIHKDVPGLFLAEMNNPASVFRLMAKIAPDKGLLSRLMAANYRDTRGWVWAHSAEQYKRVFEESFEHPNGAAGIQ